MFGYPISTDNMNSKLTIPSVTKSLIYACILLDDPSSTFYHSGIYSVCPTATNTTSTTITTSKTITTSSKRREFDKY